jgi:hypothetical protein
MKGRMLNEDLHPNRHPEAQLSPIGYQELRKIINQDLSENK